MDNRVVLIEMTDSDFERRINSTAGYEVVASFKSIGAALGQSIIFQPEIFLLDVDDNDNIDAIAEFIKAYPAAEIICTMSRWNADVAAKCTAVGAKGCIVKTDSLTDAIKIMNRRGSKPAKTIAFFSAKGLSGKTTFIANLAMSLGENVGIIDADMEFGDMAIFFSVNPATTIIDAANAVSPADLNGHFTNVNKNIKLLSSPKRPKTLDADTVTKIVRMSGDIFRYVLIDLPAGINPMVMKICGLADTIFATAMLNTGFEIEHMKRALKYFESQGKRLNVVFSKVTPYTEEARKELIGKLNYSDVTILPEDTLLAELVNDGRTLERTDLNSPVANRFNRIARALME